MQVGTIASLWRYPVKSLLGESLDRLAIEPRGAAGDRLFAIRDEDGKFGSGKTTRRFRRMDGLFGLRARYEGDLPVIGFPDGRLLHASDPALPAALSAHVGQPVTLAREADVSHFDAGPVHLVTTASLRTVGSLLGEEAVDPRRFRPNLVIDCEQHGFPEETWLGRTIAVGDTVRLRIASTTERCAMTTFAQADLPQDLRVLRELVRTNDTRLGVYAEVLVPGLVRAGDPVTLL